MERLTREIGEARALVRASQERDLRRGLQLAYILMAASFWLVSLVAADLSGAPHQPADPAVDRRACRSWPRAI